MDPWPPVTEAMIRQQASADSFQRGDVYQAQGAVVGLVRRGQQLQAEVEGSQVEPYTVQITWDGVGIQAGRWLEKARAAYRAAGGQAEWQTYLGELIARHRRKHSLVPMLEALRR